MYIYVGFSTGAHDATAAEATYAAAAAITDAAASAAAAATAEAGKLLCVNVVYVDVIPCLRQHLCAIYISFRPTIYLFLSSYRSGTAAAATTTATAAWLVVISSVVGSVGK